MKSKIALALSTATILFVLIGLGYGPVESFLDSMARAKFDKITASKEPLNSSQVVALLGQPSQIDDSNSAGLNRTVYHYQLSHSRHDMIVVFVNGVVFKTAYMANDL